MQNVITGNESENAITMVQVTFLMLSQILLEQNRNTLFSGPTGLLGYSLFSSESNNLIKYMLLNNQGYPVSNCDMDSSMFTMKNIYAVKGTFHKT